MADISAEIAAFKDAVYGEDVRDAMVSLANKINTESSEAAETVAEYSGVKSALDQTVWGNNLIGMNPNVYYPVKIPEDSYITISTSDGSIFPLNGTLQLQLYDKNKARLGEINIKNGDNKKTSLLSSIYFAGLRFFKWNEEYNVPIMINMGQTPFAYEKYVPQNSELNSEIIYINSVIDDITNKQYVELKTHNMINPANLKHGYYVDYTTGNLISHADFYVTDYIQVNALDDYTYYLNATPAQAVQQMAFYDKTKHYISGLSNAGVTGSVTITVPSNGEYVVWSINKTMIKYAQLAKGSSFDYFNEFRPYDNVYEHDEVTVGTGGSFTSLLEALKTTPANTIIRLKAGTYDIIEEYKDYYGNNFFSSQYRGYDGQSDEFMRGLWLAKGRKIYGESGVVISCVYPGVNVYVKENFSVFANDGDVEISNLTIVFGGVRYAIHDDFQPKDSKVIFRNILFDGTPYSVAVIGAGLGVNVTYEIRDCVFENNSQEYDISYHGNTDVNKTQNKCKIFVDNCFGLKKCAFKWYGKSVLVSDCIVNNSKFSEISCTAFNENQTIENMRLIQWNNA